MVLHLGDDRTFVVSLRDASAAAALVNGELARQRGRSHPPWGSTLDLVRNALRSS